MPAPKSKGSQMSDERSPEEIAANAQLLHAQAAKAEIEIERARLDLDVARLTADSKRILDEATVRKTEIEIQMGQESVLLQRIAREAQEVSTRAVQRLEQEEMASNRYNRVYHFAEIVSPSSVRSCMNQIDKWKRMEPGCEFEIVFSSPGGDVLAGLTLFDYIKQAQMAGHIVTTSTLGMAASMAAILLQAGDVRKMSKESYLLIHEVSFGAGGKIGEMEDLEGFFKKMQTRIVKIFTARSKMTPAEFMKRWRRKDWFIDSDEAFKLGLVDEIG